MSVNPLSEVAQTTTELRKSYDELPYPNRAKPFTHIARHAAIGRLRGLTPVCLSESRVLELGCADGENLLPMAAQFPQSRFFGIDLSPVQIEIGREKAKTMSIANLELSAADILELDADALGHFDYVIAHGVFSWVPSAVQQRILTICRDHLSEHGLAYISYNTYPGSRGKQALREMLQYHVRGIDSPREKAEAALAFLAAIPGSAELPGEPATILVDRLRHDLDNVEDPVTYLVHEYLVDKNQPLHFADFVRRVEALGLQYVDDAFPGGAALDRLPPAARQWVVEKVDGYLEQQQYVDFMCNVSFRRSLLCHENLSLQRAPTFDSLQRLYVTATCKQEESEGDAIRFRTDPGRPFSIDHPGLAKTLACLVDTRPASISVTRLRGMLGNEISDHNVAEIFHGLLNNAAVEFTSHPAPCTRDAGEYPFASRIARHQAADGIVTSAAHRPVRLSDVFERHLLALLDGTRSVAELGSLMRKRLTPDKPVDDAQWEGLIQEHLLNLAELGLLADSAGESR